MREEKRELLTKKYVKEELLFYNSADIKTSILAIGMMSFIAIMMSFLFAIASLIFSIVVLSVFLILDLGFVYCIFLELGEKKVIENDGFEVVTDKVLYKREDFEIKRRFMWGRIRSGKTVRRIHLENFGNIKVDSTKYDLATNGDIFYVVVCHYKKPTPALFYSERTHVYNKYKW